MKHFTCACFDTQCLSTLSTRIVAAVDMTDSLRLFRSRQLPDRKLTSPTLHLPPALIDDFALGGLWSRGLLDADVAIANAAAAVEVLLLKSN